MAAGNLYLDTYTKAELDQDVDRLGILASLEPRIATADPHITTPAGRASERIFAAVLPEGIRTTCIFASNSLSDRVYLTIRLQLTPSIARLLPPGFTIALQCSVVGFQNPSLRVTRILKVSDVPPRPFEVALEVIPFTSRAKVADTQRTDNVVTPDFLIRLPNISQLTSSRVVEWEEYLEWRQKVVEMRIAGIRYLSVSLHDTGPQFVVASESEGDFEGLVRRVLKATDLRAFKPGVSTRPWEFDPDPNVRNGTGDSIDLGYFRGWTPMSASELDAAAVAVLADCPWTDPFLARVRYKFSHLESERLTGDDDSDPGSIRRQILERYPVTGFLAVSAVGDLVLLDRQNKALRQFKLQSAVNPNLSNLLFDVTTAAVPGLAPTITDWLSPLNEDQRAAVIGAVAAPELYLIQGPPGTGKTTTIAEVIYQLVQRGQKVLLASQTHVAVDNALSRLRNHPSIRALRLGRADRLSDEAMLYTEERFLETHYRAVAHQCRATRLDPWRRLDQRLTQLERWLDQAGFLQTATAETIARLEAARVELAEAEQVLAAANDARQAADRRNQERAEARQQLARFRDGLRTRQPGPCVLPEAILRFFAERIVPVLDGLLVHGILLNREWIADDPNMNPSRRSLLVGQLLQAWFALVGDLPTLAADVERLARAGSGPLLDAATAADLAQVEAQLAQLDEQLENPVPEQIERWRQLRQRRKGLLAQARLLDEAVIRRIFNREDGHQSAGQRWLQLAGQSPAEACKGLSAVHHALEETQHGIDAALIELDALAVACAAELRDEPIDALAAVRAQTQVQRCRAQVDSSRQAMIDRATMVRELIGRVREQEPVAVTADSGDAAAVAALLDELRARRAQLVDELAGLRDFRQLWEPLLAGWVERLEDPRTASVDLTVLKSTVIGRCNVIGVTCTESPYTLQSRGFDSFDTVIVDEVSKATPPELLLPMLLGRKTILVGDHRQLPPTFNEVQGTFADAAQLHAEQDDLDESADDPLSRENVDRFRRLVTASLFKEHFEQAAPSLKATLITQYRMHPDIQAVVNHFYEDRLRCGLADADRERQHGITLPGADGLSFLQPRHHALWIDTSRDPSGVIHVEGHGDRARVNTLEARLIAELLTQLDAALASQGHGTRLPRREVGVVSFYAGQARELMQVTRRRRYPALQLTINSVERFQGRERPIILVSLVRNPRRVYQTAKNHVTQFERINVAMSRAQALLVVFGACRLFEQLQVPIANLDRPGERVTQLYGEMIGDLRRAGTVFEPTRIMTPQRWAQVQRDEEGEL